MMCVFAILEMMYKYILTIFNTKYIPAKIDHVLSQVINLFHLRKEMPIYLLNILHLYPENTLDRVDATSTETALDVKLSCSWLYGFYGISIGVGYLMSNPFL